MNFGTLYIVATPIGNLGDFSPRAVEVLRYVELIAVEDTRHSRYLLDHFAIATPVVALHDHNEQQRNQHLLTQLLEGKTIALISDAGTPLISDPGYRLVQSAQAQSIKVVPIPGPCALITALSAAGLPSDRFVFEGFLPAKSAARQKRLQAIKYEPRTLIFYEAPHRIIDLITDMMTVLGEARYAVIARELTKTFETIHGDTLKALLAWLQTDSNQQKGEFVVLVKGAEANLDEASQLQTEKILTLLLGELPTSRAVQLAAQITGEKKNKLYEMALKK